MKNAGPRDLRPKCSAVPPSRSEEMGIHFPTAEWKNTESKSADIARPSYRYRALSIDKDIELRIFQIADPDSVLLVFAYFQFRRVTANGQQFLVSVPPENPDATPSSKAQTRPHQQAVTTHQRTIGIRTCCTHSPLARRRSSQSTPAGGGSTSKSNVSPTLICCRNAGRTIC